MGDRVFHPCHGSLQPVTPAHAPLPQETPNFSASYQDIVVPGRRRPVRSQRHETSTPWARFTMEFDQRSRC